MPKPCLPRIAPLHTNADVQALLLSKKGGNAKMRHPGPANYAELSPAGRCMLLARVWCSCNRHGLIKAQLQPHHGRSLLRTSLGPPTARVHVCVRPATIAVPIAAQHPLPLALPPPGRHSNPRQGRPAAGTQAMVCVTHYVAAGMPAFHHNVNSQATSQMYHAAAPCASSPVPTAGRASPGLLLRCGSGQTSR